VDALNDHSLGWPLTLVKERWLELVDDCHRTMVRCGNIGAPRANGAAVAEPETTSSRRYSRTVADIRAQSLAY
jgi:hypothetical protein